VPEIIIPSRRRGLLQTTTFFDPQQTLIQDQCAAKDLWRSLVGVMISHAGSGDLQPRLRERRLIKMARRLLRAACHRRA